MINVFGFNRLILIGFHLLLGFACTLPMIPRFYGLLIIVLGCLSIILNKNKNNEALLFASYLVGAEVFLRMTQGVVLYETGKYGVLLFLIIGAWLGKNTNKPNLSFVFYILLMLLGIVFTSVPEGESIRKAIVFNLSGPILLGFCAIYFYKRIVNKETIYKALFVMLLPILSMSSYLYFRTPNIEEIVFGGVANFYTSGGFGPNQVATVLGLGIFISGVFLFSRKKLSGFLLIDLIILIYLTYRGLLTFSRGGLVAGIVVLVVFSLFYVFYKKSNLLPFLQMLGLAFVVGIGVWIYTSNVTKGMLDNRYTGKNASGIQKKDITSGRLDILTVQFNNFMEHPITGIGVGNGKYERLHGEKNVTAASHNEVGRLIEEHGLIGILSLLLLFTSPVALFFRGSFLQKAFIISFFLLWIFTIGHSAMRIAFPSFIYGLSLINLKDDQ